ncbi:MAG: hypothetical protein N4A39_03380, partial [Roseicyclus sp.]|nr:hypothetical protein [Roseicyclus sp.]
MSIRSIVTGLALAAAVFAASGAQAGGSSTTTTTDAFPPGAATVGVAAFTEGTRILSGGGTLNTTVTPTGDAVTTLPSGTTVSV